jgi:hypothetical protein
MSALGITTLKHGLYGIPGIHAATPGPKDPMHTLNEGRVNRSVLDLHMRGGGYTLYRLGVLAP